MYAIVAVMLPGGIESSLWEYFERQRVESKLLDYCEMVDALDIEGMEDLFTDDCAFDFGFGDIVRGRQKVLQTIEHRVASAYTHTSHHLSNIRIDFVNRDRAIAKSYVFAWHRQASDGRQRSLFGRYYDELVLLAEGWRIRERRIRMAGEDGYPYVDGRPGPYELISRRGR